MDLKFKWDKSVLRSPKKIKRSELSKLVLDQREKNIDKTKVQEE